jgi:hypothetical protein
MKQHPGARTGSRGKRPEGEIGHPMPEEIGKATVKKSIASVDVTVVTFPNLVVKFKLNRRPAINGARGVLPGDN